MRKVLSNYVEVYSCLTKVFPIWRNKSFPIFFWKVFSYFRKVISHSWKVFSYLTKVFYNLRTEFSYSANEIYIHHILFPWCTFAFSWNLLKCFAFVDFNINSKVESHTSGQFFICFPFSLFVFSTKWLICQFLCLSQLNFQKGQQRWKCQSVQMFATTGKLKLTKTTQVIELGEKEYMIPWRSFCQSQKKLVWRKHKSFAFFLSAQLWMYEWSSWWLMVVSGLGRS